MNDYARRLNTIGRLLGARRYLEIGVLDGATFREIEIAERTGVDPEFRFDIGELVNDSTRLISTTSDNFFATEPLFPPYDVVFIDGLHTFEQVVRDLSNTLLRTHRHSAVVIDDTIPNDVYSSIPNQQAALRYRTAAGGNDGMWMGDVFKLIFYIHDFWPNLNYRTIVGSGSPQTLLWRADGFSMQRKPLFNDLERISRLTYFDLQEHFGVLQTASEDEAIGLCVAQSKVTHGAIHLNAAPQAARDGQNPAGISLVPVEANRMPTSGVTRHGNSRILAAVTFYFNKNRLSFLADVLRSLSEFDVETMDIIVITNTNIEHDVSLLYRLVLEIQPDKIPAVRSYENLADPFDLTWCHKKIIRTKFIESNKNIPRYSHFIYLEDDMRLNFYNFCYFLEFRERLKHLNLIPAFLRVEFSNKLGGFVNTDNIVSFDITGLPNVDFGDTSLVNLPNPYNACFILDQDLATEYIDSRSFDYDASNSVGPEWGVRERAAMGLCFENVPEPFQHRYVVPINKRTGQCPLYAWISHLANNFADDPGVPWSKVRMDQLVVGAKIGHHNKTSARRAYLMTWHGTLVGVDNDNNLVQVDIEQADINRLVCFEEAEHGYLPAHDALAEYVIEMSPQGVSLIRNDKYLCADPYSDALVADRDAPSSWETFSLVTDEKMRELKSPLRASG